MKAHDARHLTVCPACHGMGDKRRMTQLEIRGEQQAWLHGRCAIAAIGLDAFLALPIDRTENLTLDDIGVTAMQALIEKNRRH